MTVIFRGFPACECLAEWLPAYEFELQRRRLLTGPLSIFQLIGGAPASGGTHTDGGAADITDPHPSGEDLWVARQMGADAGWLRLPPAFIRHHHLVLRGCPHNGPARYQIDAVDDGFNGLGSGGRGGRDDGPRPLSGRTWREGIAWAKAQQEADDMHLTDKLYPKQGDDSPTVGDALRAALTSRDRDARVLAELKDIEAGFARGEKVERLQEKVANLRARLEAAEESV